MGKLSGKPRVTPLYLKIYMTTKVLLIISFRELLHLLLLDGHFSQIFAVKIEKMFEKTEVNEEEARDGQLKKTFCANLNSVKIFRASVKAFLILLTLLGRGLVVAQGRGEDAGAVLHQEPDHRQVVAGRRAVKRSPTVRVRRVDVASELDQEPEDQSKG